MARKALTARFVETIKVETRTDFWDDVVRGLVLRVSPSGVKAWTVVYTRDSDSAKRRVTLGKFPGMDLHKARSKALANLSAISEGDDPAAKKRARREAMTIRELGGLYIEKYAKRNKRTWAEDERLLKVEVYPAIGEMKALGVKRRDVLDLIEGKAEQGHIAQSTQLLAVVRKMFNWAVDGDYLEVSPAMGIRPRAKPVRRDRVLSEDETRTIWTALDTVALTGELTDILRLLFLTGQRSGEVCGMRRREVDLHQATWTLPGERTKNKLVHIVPLAPAALAIIERRLDAADDGADAPLFTRIGTSIESNALAQAVRLKLQLDLPRWTPHDIRRTVSTGMNSIGIAPHVVEAALNHISGFRAGVAGVYNRHQYDKEKRRAMEAWQAHLTMIRSETGNVVAFDRVIGR